MPLYTRIDKTKPVPRGSPTMRIESAQVMMIARVRRSRWPRCACSSAWPAWRRERALEQANNDVAQRGVAAARRAAISSTTAWAATPPSTCATTAWRPDLGLTEQQLIDNLMFAGESPHSTMTDRACAPTTRKQLVRRGAARPVADRAQHAARTTSTRSCKSFYAGPDPRRPASTTCAARCGDAARAVGAAGHAGGRLGRRARTRRATCRRTSRNSRWPTRQADARGVRPVRARYRQLPGVHRRALQPERQALGFWVIAFLLFFSSSPTCSRRNLEGREVSRPRPARSPTTPLWRRNMAPRGAAGELQPSPSAQPAAVVRAAGQGDSSA